MASSVGAVAEESIKKPRINGIYLQERLPPYASPPTPSQRKTWRQLGVIPLTRVQRVQCIAAALDQPPTEDHEAELANWADPGALGACLTAERRDAIRLWRHQDTAYDTAWDQEARRKFAEATLELRAL